MRRAPKKARAHFGGCVTWAFICLLCLYNRSNFLFCIPNMSNEEELVLKAAQMKLLADHLSIPDCIRACIPDEKNRGRADDRGFQMRVDGAIDVDADPLSTKIAAIEEENRVACELLTYLGYNGSALRKVIPKRDLAKRKVKLTEPNTRERQELLRAKSTAGHFFHVTGGQHLTHDDQFISAEMKEREKRISGMKSAKKKRVAATQRHDAATALIASKPQLLTFTEATTDILVKDLDVVLNWKLNGEGVSKIKSKPEKVAKWIAVRNCDLPPLEPWTEEEEAELQRLENENIEVKETALGRERKRKHNELIATAPSMSPGTRTTLLGLLQAGSTTTAASTTDGETNNTVT